MGLIPKPHIVRVIFVIFFLQRSKPLNYRMANENDTSCLTDATYIRALWTMLIQKTLERK